MVEREILELLLDKATNIEVGQQTMKADIQNIKDDQQTIKAHITIIKKKQQQIKQAVMETNESVKN